MAKIINNFRNLFNKKLRNFNIYINKFVDLIIKTNTQKL